jgi:hypothetical protein
MTDTSAPIDPSTITIYEATGSDYSVAYVAGERRFTGHCDDVRENVLDLLGITLEYVPSGFIQTRHATEDELATEAGAQERLARITG